MMLECVGEPAMYEQLAEEGAEFVHACLKKARKLRCENPTPKSMADINKNLIEEFTDFIQCARELGLEPDEEQIKEKEERFKIRWTAQKDHEARMKARSDSRLKRV